MLVKQVILSSTNHGESKGAPPMPRFPQEIAGPHKAPKKALVVVKKVRALFISWGFYVAIGSPYLEDHPS